MSDAAAVFLLIYRMGVLIGVSSPIPQGMQACQSHITVMQKIVDHKKGPVTFSCEWRVSRPKLSERNV